MRISLRDSLYELSSEISKTLQMIFWENVYATKGIQIMLKLHPEWEENKRALFSEMIYDLIRWWRLLWYILDRDPAPEEKDLQKLIPIYLFFKKGDLSGLQKKREMDANQVIQRIATTKNQRVLRESIPDWLDNQGEQELGSRWNVVIASLNKYPDFVIRVNTLKTTVKELVVFLRKEGIIAEPIDWSPDALRIMEKTNVFKLSSFRAGFFEVQDTASQLVSRILDPQSGMRVVDACAGEGSKTLHIAALMKNKGKIIALDTQEWRLKGIRKRATKIGIDIIETRLISSSKIYKRLNKTADRLLLDVPCSGLGTLRRNPDIKWKLIPKDLKRLTILQQELLEKYCRITKPNGRMVYSVCSILPSEAEEQIERFLKNHTDFRLLNEKRYWPEIDGTDGFYVALIERKA
ncbi:tRNA (cytosine(49)-C(5))-methyltransferase [uncultured archaeon]|nr:tRNA (cytosine(49)-C(5))-methyltransferase [uncultured archaeon]